MFCPKCGVQLPDDAVSCSACGASIGASAPAIAFSAPASQGAPANPLKKGKYLKELATPSAKTASKLVLALLAACIAIVLIGHVVLLNTSLEKIPAISTAFEMAGNDSIGELKVELAQQLEELEMQNALFGELMTGSLSEEELELVDQTIEVMEDCSKSFSINNLQAFIKVANQLSQTDATELVNLDGDLEEITEVGMILDIISTAMLVSALLTLLFTILGGLCRVKGLVIFGAISPTIFCASFYNLFFAILILAAHVGMVIMMSKVNKEYKAYCNGTLPVNV